MSAGMAGIITAHWAQEVPSAEGRMFALRCQSEGCRWGGEFLYTDHAAHVAEELAEAGYGNVKDALLSAADEMEQERSTWCLDDSGRHWIGRTLSELRQRAHSLDPEGRALVQAIHDRKAEA